VCPLATLHFHCGHIPSRPSIGTHLTLNRGTGSYSGHFSSAARLRLLGRQKNLMNRFRATLLLSYLFLGLVCLGMALGISYRSTDPIWGSTLRDVRWEYDLLAISIICLALLVALGLFLKREWGRVLSISLSFIVLFMFVGIPLVASWWYKLNLAPLVSADSLIMGSLALLNAIALSHRRFSARYASCEPTRTSESEF
jgi:hypothetical protein